MVESVEAHLSEGCGPENDWIPAETKVVTNLE